MARPGPRCLESVATASRAPPDPLRFSLAAIHIRTYAKLDCSYSFCFTFHLRLFASSPGPAALRSSSAYTPHISRVFSAALFPSVGLSIPAPLFFSVPLPVRIRAIPPQRIFRFALNCRPNFQAISPLGNFGGTPSAKHSGADSWSTEAPEVRALIQKVLRSIPRESPHLSRRRRGWRGAREKE